MRPFSSSQFSNILQLNLLPRFHSLVIDVTMALDTLSLPVLEPLTPGRLLDMTVLALSCLYAGMCGLYQCPISFRGTAFTKDPRSYC